MAKRTERRAGDAVNALLLKTIPSRRAVIAVTSTATAVNFASLSGVDFRGMAVKLTASADVFMLRGIDGAAPATLPASGVGEKLTASIPDVYVIDAISTGADGDADAGAVVYMWTATTANVEVLA